MRRLKRWFYGKQKRLSFVKLNCGGGGGGSGITIIDDSIVAAATLERHRRERENDKKLDRK